MIKESGILSQVIVCQANNQVVSDMGGEKVMLSIQNGKYYNLGKMGGEIWGHLKQPISIGKLVYLLMETYQVNQKECETEVVAFLELLLNEQLIEIHKHPKVVDHE